MSNLPRHEFPTLEQTNQTPSWLNPKGVPADSVRSLVAILQGEPPSPAPQPSMPAPQAAAAPPPPPPPPPPQEQLPDLPPQHELHLDLHDEAGRLPAPPGLGSLLPGGRSNPPPPNDDHDHDLQEHIQAFASAALELAIARQATLAVMEGQLLDLAVEIAAAVIEREVESDRSLHLALARAALQSIGDANRVTLRTSHDGYAAITAAHGGDDIEIRGVRVHVVADSEIPGLGCVVDGENVRVDATVSERLRAVRRAFEEERRRTLESVE